MLGGWRPAILAAWGWRAVEMIGQERGMTEAKKSVGRGGSANTGWGNRVKLRVDRYRATGPGRGFALPSDRL
jgi:hypothetical protein